jgi:hypothetical protein
MEKSCLSQRAQVGIKSREITWRQLLHQIDARSHKAMPFRIDYGKNSRPGKRQQSNCDPDRPPAH